VSFKISDKPEDDSWVFLEKTKGRVAGGTEQPAPNSRSVIVVNV
jgi:hypothetical protein